MRSKRGMSEALEWVLFTGFIVVAAIGVFAWQRSLVDEHITPTADYLEGGQECEDVRILLGCDSSGMNVTNAGVLSFDAVLLRSETVSTVNEGKLKPYESRIITVSGTFEITPMVKVNEKLFTCSQKKKSITC